MDNVIHKNTERKTMNKFIILLMIYAAGFWVVWIDIGVMSF